jgi:hypothetical protein
LAWRFLLGGLRDDCRRSVRGRRTRVGTEAHLANWTKSYWRIQRCQHGIAAAKVNAHAPWFLSAFPDQEQSRELVRLSLLLSRCWHE